MASYTFGGIAVTRDSENAVTSVQTSELVLSLPL